LIEEKSKTYEEIFDYFGDKNAEGIGPYDPK